MSRPTSPIRWMTAALLALLVSLGAVTAAAACAGAGPATVSASAPADDCDPEREGAAADCGRHCAVLCAVVRPAGPSLSGAVSEMGVAYLLRATDSAGLQPVPERPPPR